MNKNKLHNDPSFNGMMIMGALCIILVAFAYFSPSVTVDPKYVDTTNNNDKMWFNEKDIVKSFSVTADGNVVASEEISGLPKGDYFIVKRRELTFISTMKKSRK